MQIATSWLLTLALATVFPGLGETARWAPGATISNEEAARQVAARKKRRKKRRRKPPPSPPPTPPAPEPTPPAVPVDLPPPPALPTKYRAVAVLPVQDLDVGEELVREVERALFNEVDEMPGMRAVSPTDVMSDLVRYGLDPAACDGDVRCLATSGRYARSHLALASRVAALGGTLSVSMRLVDAEAGTEVGRVADMVSEESSQRAQQMHRLAVQLLAPETYVGTLIVKSSVDGAEVYLDDKLIGTTPLAGALEDLTAGPHILRISKPGFADVNQFVDVIYKRSSTVSVDLTNATIAGVIVEVASKTGFGSLFVACNVKGVEIRVDGEPVGATLLAQAIEKIAAGKRRVSLRKDGVEPLSTEVEIAPDQRTDIGVTVADGDFQFGKIVAAAAASPLPAYADLVEVAAVGPTVAAAIEPVWVPTWKLYTGLAVAGAGAASIGVSGYFGSRVEKLQDNYDTLYARLETLPAGDERTEVERKYNATGDRGKAAQLKHFLSLGAGIGLVVIGGGLVLWDLVSDPAPHPATSASPTVYWLDVGVAAAPGGAQVIVRGAW